jgi:integrase
LPACRACDLQWSQVELTTGRLHVRRAKNGSPSVHPLQGDEIRALRRLQREQGPSSHLLGLLVRLMVARFVVFAALIVACAGDCGSARQSRTATGAAGAARPGG